MKIPVYINLGCGENKLPEPWENYDRDVDITKPLPWADWSVKYIFAEHVFEHLTIQEGWAFLKEAYRVLKEDGKLRIAVPSIERVWRHSSREYLAWVKSKGWGEDTLIGAFDNLINQHGHKQIVTNDGLSAQLWTLGFYNVENYESGKSRTAAFVGIEGHGKVIGNDFNWIETLCVEATK